MNAEDRKQLIAYARDAIRAKDLAAMRRLLRALPSDSTKMQNLRRDLEHQVRILGAQVTQESPLLRPSPSPGPPAVMIPDSVEANGAPSRGELMQVKSGGRTFYIRYDGSDDKFLRVRVEGGRIVIIVNPDHRAFNALADASNCREVSPNMIAILAAWALLELEAGSEARADKIQEVREDWTRLLRRLMTTDE